MNTTQLHPETRYDEGEGSPPDPAQDTWAVDAVGAAIDSYRSKLLADAGREEWLEPLKALVRALEPLAVAEARQSLSWVCRVVVDVVGDRVVPVDPMALFTAENVAWWEHRALAVMPAGSVSTARVFLRRVQAHLRGEPVRRRRLPRPAADSVPLTPSLLQKVVDAAVELGDDAVVALIAGVGAGMAAVGVDGATIGCDGDGRVWVTHRSGRRRPVAPRLSALASGFDGAVASKAGWARARVAAASAGASMSLEAVQVTHTALVLADGAPTAVSIVESGLSRRSIEAAVASMVSPSPLRCAALLRGVS